MKTKTPYQLRKQMHRICDTWEATHDAHAEEYDPRIVTAYHNVFLRYIRNMRRYIDGNSSIKSFGDIGQYTPVPASVYAKQV